MDEQRVQMCREWLVRYALPFYLDHAGRSEMAARLRTLPDVLTVEVVNRALREARDEAWSARCDAVDRLAKEIRAEPTATAAAGAAVDVAVTADVVVVVAVAAAVTVDAVVAATVDAVVAATVDAVGDAVAWRICDQMWVHAAEIVRKFNREITPSAFELLDRMLPMEIIQLPIAEDAVEVCGIPILR